MSEFGKPPAARSPRRFIPKEELPEVSAWTIGALGAPGRRPMAARPAAPAPAAEAADEAARRAAYEQGYQAGLKALEDYRRNQGEQFAQRMVGIAGGFATELKALESQLAEEVVSLALHIARQVVRSELAVHPERIAPVVMEALAALVESKGSATIYVHPQDLPVVLDHVGDELAVQGYSILPDAALAPGGCRIDGGVSSVDASITTRWQRAVAAIGRSDTWEAAWDDRRKA